MSVSEPRDFASRRFEGLPARALPMTGTFSTTMFDFLVECVRFPTVRTESAWKEHAPLALGLAKALAPRRFVELGTHHGQSFFAIAEGMGATETSHRGEAVAIDSWEGDPQAGYYGEDVFTGFRTRMDFFSAGVGFIRADFTQALSQFEDQSIDLLHIDGFHEYHAVRDDFMNWIPKVAPGGVVIFHDVNEFGRGFGAWKLWAKLTDLFPDQTLMLGNGHGLGIYAHEPFEDSWVSQLLSWWHEDASHRVFFQDLMMALGLAFQHEVEFQTAEARALENENANLRRQLDDVEEQLARLRSRNKRWFGLR